MDGAGKSLAGDLGTVGDLALRKSTCSANDLYTSNPDLIAALTTNNGSVTKARQIITIPLASLSGR